ncbi:MAG: LysR family transcriptional regulator [Myxococcales bacterium]|nr:LysR family transcriptional regulator [Myxococcales bacterium]
MSARLDDMPLFAAVVREGSFTGAARALGITKQSVSDRVARLEAELGVTLLARSTRRMQLTEPGERYHRACLAVVALADDAANEVRRTQREPGGLLRVTAPEVLGQELLLPVIAEVRAKHPRIRFELDLDDARVDLIERGMDVAVRLGDVPKGLASRRLGVARQVYVACPDLVGDRELRGLSALADLPCVGRAPVERWTLGRTTVRVEPDVVVTGHEGLRTAACLGLGVARISAALVSEDVRDCRLRVLFGGRPALRGPVHAVYREGSPRPRRLDLFLDTLVRHAARWPPLAG